MSEERREDPSPRFCEQLTPSDFDRLYGRWMRPRLGRPWTFANMVAGVDGAATTRGKAGGLSSALDQELFAYLRSQADVVLVGARTVRVEEYGPIAGTGGDGPALAIVTSSGDFDYASPLFQPSGAKPVLIVPRSSSRSIADRADGRAEIVVAGETRVDLTRAVNTLAERHGDMVLVEGGPSLLTELFTVGVVNELCLTIAPLVGGDDLRIMNLAGDTSRLRLEHLALNAGSVFTRYLVHPL